MDDAVGNQAATLIPEMLFIFSFEAKLPEVGVGYGSAQLVVILTPVQDTLNIPTQGGRVDIVQEVQTLNDVVIFPKGAFSFVFAGIGTEFTYDNTLGCGFKSQGDHNPLNIVPLFTNEVSVDLSDWF